MAIRLAGRRLAATAVLAVAGLAFVGLATFLVSQGLDRADQWSSVIAGFVGVVSLSASAISLMSVRQGPARESLRPVVLSTAWGTYRLRQDLVRLVEAQARAAQSLPYRVPGLGGMPMATMYVRQDLEVHRQKADGAVGERIPLDRMDVRSAEQMQLRILPMAQTVEHVLDKHRHLLVEGGPGLGKSSLARDLAARIAQAWLGATPGPAPAARPVLPLLISARALARHRGQPWVAALAMACAEQLGQHADDTATPDVLTGLPPGVAWLVIIDGLDEVTEPQREELLEVIAERMVHVDSPFRIVVLSRPLAGAARQRLRGAGTGVYTLLPFSAAALHDFVLAAFSAIRPADAASLSERFLDQLRTASLDEVARVPLLATIAIIVFASDPRRGLPRTRYELYEQYVAHLADASGVRRRQLRTRLRQRASQLRGGMPAVDALFDHDQDLIEHVAVSQVHTEEPLIDVAIQWCRSRDLFGRAAFPGLRDAVCQVLTSTGLLVQRDADIAFIHHTFAEHLAAAHHAGQLPTSFDHRDRDWRTWVDRAVTDDEMACAVLVRWTRRNPASGLLDWLEGGSHSQQFLATTLIANGAATTDAQVTRALTYIERTWATIYLNDSLAKMLRLFPRNPAVLRWAASILNGAEHAPDLQAAAARLLADQGGPSHVDTVALISRRLRDDLLPAQRSALATTLASIAPDQTDEAAASLLSVVEDELATPQQRTEAARELFTLGPSHRGQAARDLGEILEGPRLGPLDRAAVARVLAEFVSDYRDAAAAAVRAALADREALVADRPMLAQFLAELGDDAAAEEVLSAAANDVYLDALDRVRAARTLADLGTAQRRSAAETLHTLATGHSIESWHRRFAAQRLAELGAEHQASAATALCAVLGDTTANPWQHHIAAQMILKLPVRHRDAALSALWSGTAGIAEDVRTSVAAARAVLDPAHLPEAEGVLRSIMSDLFATDNARHNAACMLANLGQEGIAAACSTLLSLARHAVVGWERAYAAYWLAIIHPQQQRDAAACFRDVLADPRLTPHDRLFAAWYMAEVISFDRHLPAPHLHATLAQSPDISTTTRTQMAEALSRLSRRDHLAMLDALTAIAGDPAAPTDQRLNACAVLMVRDRNSRRRAAEALSLLANDSHTAPADRAAAADLLGRAPKDRDQARSVLSAILSDPHTAAPARLAANAALDHLEPNGRTERLATARRLLADPDTPTEARLDAVEWLCRIGDASGDASDALQAIATVATDRTDLRRTARVLLKHGPSDVQRAAQILRRRLADPYLTHGEAAAVAGALAELGPEQAVEATAALSTLAAEGDLPPTTLVATTRELLELAAHARRTAVGALQNLLNRSGVDVDTQLVAIRLMIRVAATTAEVVAAARQLLSDPRPQPGQRREIAEFIAERTPDDPDAVACLFDLLRQERIPIDVRAAAALAFAAVCPGQRDALDERLDAMLAAANTADRIVAAVSLARWHPDRAGDAIDVLSDIARRGELTARWHAMNALTAIPQGRADAASSAQALLATGDLTVADRCRVARLMTELGPAARDHAAAELIGLLADTTLGAAERRTVAVALGQISPIYRDVAAAHLHALATAAGPSTQRRLATASLAELSPVYRQQAAALLRARLHQPDLRPAQRVQAAAELAATSRSYTPEAAQALLATAQDGSLATAIRFAAAQHLIDRRAPGWEDAAQVLEEILAHPDTPAYLTRQSAQALIHSSRAHRRTAIAALVRLTTDGSVHPHDRFDAAVTICEKTAHTEEAVHAIRDLARQPPLPPDIRRRAAARLAAQEPAHLAEAATTLRDIHRDPHAPAEIRAQAAANLADISPTLLTEATSRLAADLAEGRLAVRVAAARSLSRLGPTQRAEAVRHIHQLRHEADADRRTSGWIARASRRIDRLDDLDPRET